MGKTLVGLVASLLLLTCLLAPVVSADHPEVPPFDVVIYYWLPGGVYTEVQVINMSHPFGAYITDPKHREQVIDGNWGIKIINKGDKIEPVQVAYHMTEMDRGDIRNYYGLVGLFYAGNPPPDVLMKQQFSIGTSFEASVPVCGATSCPITQQDLRIQCRKVGEANFTIEIAMLARGEGLRFNLYRKCVTESLNHYGSDDWGHLFPPLGFLLYITYILLNHLGLTAPLGKLSLFKACKKGYLQLRAFTGKAPEQPSKDPMAKAWDSYQNEQIIFMCIGFFLMLILSADIPAFFAGRFPKHFIFGAFIALTGLLGLLLSTTVLRRKSFMFVSCMIYIYLGFFFLWHEQYTYFAYFMHTVFGYLLIMVGLLSWLRYIYPQTTILFCLIGNFACATFIGTDNGLVVEIQPLITPHHFVLGLLNFVILYMVVVVGIAYVYLRWTSAGVPNQHLPLKSLNDFSAERDDGDDGKMSEHEY